MNITTDKALESGYLLFKRVIMESRCLRSFCHMAIGLAVMLYYRFGSSSLVCLCPCAYAVYPCLVLSLTLFALLFVLNILGMLRILAAHAAALSVAISAASFGDAAFVGGGFTC